MPRCEGERNDLYCQNHVKILVKIPGKKELLICATNGTVPHVSRLMVGVFSNFFLRFFVYDFVCFMHKNTHKCIRTLRFQKKLSTDSGYVNLCLSALCKRSFLKNNIFFSRTTSKQFLERTKWLSWCVLETGILTAPPCGSVSFRYLSIFRYFSFDCSIYQVLLRFLDEALKA